MSDRDWEAFDKEVEEAVRDILSSSDGRRSVHPLQDPALAWAFLDQGDAWAAGGGYIRIEAMDPTHALNVLVWLLERADSIAMTLFVANDDLVSELYEARASRKIVIDSKLFRALMVRAGAPQKSSGLPWASVASAR